jgi:hypothetical protein
MHTPEKYSDWMMNGLKIFVVVFLLGKLINTAFVKLQRRYKVQKSITFALLHLMFILTFSYFLHIYTSHELSLEMNITSPSVLYSGLLLNMQTNLFVNLGV